MSVITSLRGVLRRDIVLLCLVVFAADIVLSMLWPTFSLFAISLGSSLTLAGALNSVVGLTQFFTSVPLGALSDRQGRKTVLTLGMLGFALAMLSFALAPSPWLLFPGRILIGLATTAVFWIGVAYLGDIITTEERGPAFGLYTTSMGLGITVGPLIGALVAAPFGVRVSYIVGALIALAGSALAWWGLRATARGKGGVRSVRVGFGFGEARHLLRNPNLLAGCIGNLASSLAFSGAVTSFFPVQAAQLGAGQASISTMFSARALGSTLVRMPTGMLISKVSSWLVLLAALSGSLLAMSGMSLTGVLGLLAALLILEGMSYGIYLTAGQAFVAEHSSPMTRGSSIGVYTTTGSIGSTLGPLVLGIIADIWGVSSVFGVTALVALVALVAMAFLYTQRRTTLGRTPSALPPR